MFTIYRCSKSQVASSAIGQGVDGTGSAPYSQGCSRQYSWPNLLPYNALCDNSEARTSTVVMPSDVGIGSSGFCCWLVRRALPGWSLLIESPIARWPRRSLRPSPLRSPSSLGDPNSARSSRPLGENSTCSRRSTSAATGFCSSPRDSGSRAISPRRSSISHWPRGSIPSWRSVW